MTNERDLFLLKILEKVTIANNKQLMILGGYRDPSVARKRLNHLKSEGYIDAGWLGDHIVYTLTQAGLRELEKTRRPYDIRGIKSEHEELVTDAACWIYIRAGRGINDMIFDHEMNARTDFKRTGHKPDIVFSLHQAVEIELSTKKMHGKGSHSGLAENFEHNARNYSRQIWIVPERKTRLISNIRDLSKKNIVEKNTMIVTVEQMKRDILQYNPTSNQPRMEPVKGTPSPLHTKERRIELDA